MLRRWLLMPLTAGLPATLLSSSDSVSRGSCVRCVGSWQQSAKQSRRFSKEAMMEGRKRHHWQKEVAALRQHINEEHGLQQRQRAQLRQRCDRAATALIHGASRGSSASAANALATARHLLTLQEATRKAMKSEKSRRKAMFVSGKKWRG
ncbi:hypothetical protein C3747_206g192c [Trypanosoma cruzi]|uniref:Uncharacterized protein n=2 Tax=Trypanosoma cruzi TaxID=5693 RepID=Q4E018_TRYCC|nr:hypothetical protein, conserved [Trypanosoma cruzi]EAN98132.1 hypothetical protein, conserved [Trypanosoma cruzi]PWV00484.1 hypothetical protein C3747_206g192c [Trypanosoma cruzi]RNC46566.1 hypothetical protein TcCL_NonESM03644 [Trypanosoma cruzi]|eukprot:XP_819983.1 hypothetical protein [Trypanosoma cruzi strain CL Brener]